MKTKNEFLFAACFWAGLLCLAQKVNAQNPWKTNGNNIGISNFLGSTNKADVILKSNDTARMSIDKFGNINMFSPMSVDSNATFRGQVLFTSGSGSDGILPEPNLFLGSQDDYWFTTNKFCIMGASFYAIFPRPHWAANQLQAFGISTQTPNFMVDVFCSGPNTVGFPIISLPPSKRDINISSAAYGTFAANSAGYRIGGNTVMFHNGDISSFYLGVGAGFPQSNVISTPFNFNTFVGYQADLAFNGTNGQGNTAVGYKALTSNTANDNTAVGQGAGLLNITGTHSWYGGAGAGT